MNGKVQKRIAKMRNGKGKECSEERGKETQEQEGDEKREAGKAKERRKI